MEIEHYSPQTVRSYTSALKLFIKYSEKLNANKIADEKIYTKLHFCSKSNIILFREAGNRRYPLYTRSSGA